MENNFKSQDLDPQILNAIKKWLKKSFNYPFQKNLYLEKFIMLLRRIEIDPYSFNGYDSNENSFACYTKNADMNRLLFSLNDSKLTIICNSIKSVYCLKNNSLEIISRKLLNLSNISYENYITTFTINGYHSKELIVVAKILDNSFTNKSIQLTDLEYYFAKLDSFNIESIYNEVVSHIQLKSYLHISINEESYSPKLAEIVLESGIIKCYSTSDISKNKTTALLVNSANNYRSTYDNCNITKRENKYFIEIKTNTEDLKQINIKEIIKNLEIEVSKIASKLNTKVN